MTTFHSSTALCLFCGRKFPRYPSAVKRSIKAYCSPECWKAAHHPLYRFCAKVGFCQHDLGQGCSDCCWLWQGKRNKAGYGLFYVEMRNDKPREILAHRAIWQIVYGSCDSTLFVCHNCPAGDNPSCVNPLHLWLGDAAANHADMQKKGRGPIGDRNGARKHPTRIPRGETHYHAALTTARVQTVHELALLGWTQTEIGKHLDIDHKQVWKILHGNMWAHVKKEFDRCQPEQSQKSFWNWAD